MTIAPTGVPVGLPTTSCDAPPPPLVGGGVVATPVQTPVQSPMQVPSTAAPAVAALGASSLTQVPTGGLFASAPVTINGGAAAAPAAALPPMVAAPGLAPVAAAGAPVAAAAPTAAPARHTTHAPGGTQSDANLVESTLGILRQSPSGAQMVDRLLAVKARVNVVSDAEFNALGHGDAHAFYDPKQNAMFLRRSDLADATKQRFAAVALAHEGTHLLDDVGGVANPFIDDVAHQIQAAGGTTTAKGASIQAQALFELTMIKEARAFVFAGQVAKDLGVQTPTSDPTSVAAAGGNDQATYAKVWTSLLSSAYNPDHRSAAVRSF
jgi:hypothetical protein